jgi:hypothetical protein
VILEQILVWIETQSYSIIAVIAFACCYAVAGIVFFLSRAIVGRRFTEQLKATTPVMLTPLAVILGLLFAFVASRVWNNVDHANTFIRQESGAIQETLLLAEAFPSNTQKELQLALRHYLQFAVSEEWPAMMAGKANEHTLPSGLATATSIVLSFVPANRGQEIVQARTIASLIRALDARRERILLSEAAIMPMQWLVIVILTALILLTIALVHLDRPVAMAVNLFTLSTAIGACFTLLLINDRPFSAGGSFIGPSDLTGIHIN